jgi:hypothetical protein
VRILRPKPWPGAVGASCGAPRPIPPLRCRGPPRWPVSAIPSAVGVSALCSTAFPAGTMRRAQVARGAFPPADRVDVLAMATKKPTTDHCPATRWSLAELVVALRQRLGAQAMSRSSLWRLLEEADLTPHRSVYGLNSHDPDCDTQAHDICQLSVQALRCFHPGRRVICADEKTGRPMLPRAHPTQPVQPGKPEKREDEYIRHGVRALLASCVVPTGQLVWHLGPTRTSNEWASHLTNVVQQLPTMQRYAWVVDHLTTHGSLERCQLVAPWCDVPYLPKALRRGAQRRTFLSDPTPKPGFHFTPQHGSWLHQVAWWLRVLARRFLQRGACTSAHDFAPRLCHSMEGDNTHHAHPYRWTYTGQPLVRATPLRQTRRQQRQGRAWLSPRPPRFARAFYPPRPYKRATTLLVANL